MDAKMTEPLGARKTSSVSRTLSMLIDLCDTLSNKEHIEIPLSSFMSTHNISTLTARVMIDKGMVKRVKGVYKHGYSWNTNNPTFRMARHLQAEVGERAKLKRAESLNHEKEKDAENIPENTQEQEGTANLRKPALPNVKSLPTAIVKANEELEKELNQKALKREIHAMVRRTYANIDTTVVRKDSKFSFRILWGALVVEW
ncbi:MAG: hypothetical protein ACTSQA_08905 [Candidatus Heimdallarchaeaceae archaeon]